MYWPRLRLTPPELKYASIYQDPESKLGVKRRLYQGSLELNQRQRLPMFNFQLTRRCRVFGLTMIGDVHQIRIQLQDSSGEEYFPKPALAANVIQGFAASGLQSGIATGLALPHITGPVQYICPFILEPNIVLMPNQTLFIKGSEVSPWADQAYRIDFVLHVWEFPGYTKLVTLAESNSKR
jgi:hypothetical protein